MFLLDNKWMYSFDFGISLGGKGSASRRLRMLYNWKKIVSRTAMHADMKALHNAAPVL